MPEAQTDPDPVPDPAVAVARAIGRRVRTRRTERGWTLDQLADASGVSRRMVVNVEQGATNPSIATLLRLSDALGIGLPVLVDVGDEGEAVVVRRRGTTGAVWTGAGGGSAVMVAGSATPDVTELWDWRLGPGDVYSSDAHRAGTVELLHVLAGTVLLVVGDAEHRLEAGDSASFDGALPHSYGNPSDREPSRFALTVHEPAVARESS